MKLSSDKKTVTVEKGDTFWSIGKKLGIDYKELMELNGYTSITARKLAVGTVLKLSTSSSVGEFKPRYPVNFIAITQGYKPDNQEHCAIDLGWSSSHGGKNQSICAPWDGIVAAIDEAEKGGCYVKLKHIEGDDAHWFYSMHDKKNAVTVKVGQKVTQGQKIDEMGNTGNAKGNHSHAIYAITPKSIIYTNSASHKKKYAVNPIEHLYVYSDQTVGDKTKSLYKLLEA